MNIPSGYIYISGINFADPDIAGIAEMTIKISVELVELKGEQSYVVPFISLDTDEYDDVKMFLKLFTFLRQNFDVKNKKNGSTYSIVSSDLFYWYRILQNKFVTITGDKNFWADICKDTSNLRINKFIVFCNGIESSEEHIMFD